MPSPRLEPPATRAWDFSRSAAGVLVLLDHGRARGLTAEVLLAGTSLRGSLTPGDEVTARQELRVVRTLQRHLGPGEGAAVGRRYRAETFGAFGYALATSPTVLDAINVALRFIDLSHAFAVPEARLEGDRVVVSLDGRRLPADVGTFLTHRDAVAVDAVLAGLVPGGVGASLELHADHARLEFGVAELDRPVPQRDAERRAWAEQLCAQVVERRRSRTGLTRDVRVLVTQHLPDGAPMPAVAADLGLTERTLRRHLGAEGTSYRELLDEVRSALATELLGRSSLPLEVVARRLGLGSATALIVAHRRWTGRTPRDGGTAAVGVTS